MKTILKILLAALVLTLVPASYACAQRKDAKYFSEGLAWVRDTKGDWHRIDKTGKIVE